MATKKFITIDNGRILSSGSSFDPDSIPYSNTIKTLKPSDGDFNSADDIGTWIKQKGFTGRVRINVDSGSYSGTIITGTSLEDSKLPYIEIIGDSRDIAGLTYIDDVDIDSTVSNSGTGTVSLTSAANYITVVGSTTNPSFATAGYGNGDKVLVYSDSEVITMHTIASCSGNEIYLDDTAPSVGSKYSSITLLPNVTFSAIPINLSDSYPYPIILKLKGIYFSNTGDTLCSTFSSKLIMDNCVLRTNIEIQNRASIICLGRENSFYNGIMVRNFGIANIDYCSFIHQGINIYDNSYVAGKGLKNVGDYAGIFIYNNSYFNGGDCLVGSYDGRSWGIYAKNCSKLNLNGAYVYGCGKGIWVENHSSGDVVNTEVVYAEESFYANDNSYLSARSTTSTDADNFGFYATDKSFIDATGNTTTGSVESSPAASMTLGNYDSYIRK